MKLSLRRASHTGLPGTVGTARVDRRIATTLRRVRPGDVAVIDHLDLDRATAEALVETGVAVVVNARPFISGRYPNLGPEVLARAGVELVDEVGPAVFDLLKDGATVRVHDGVVHVGGEPVVQGRALDLGAVQDLMNRARDGLTAQLASFAHNTSEFLRSEQDLLLHGEGVPDLRTRMAGRPVVVVVRGFDHEADLRRVRRFIRERNPVLVGVDAGADVLLAAGLTPDLTVLGAGGLDQPGPVRGPAVSDDALRRSREVLLHADSSDRLVGAERLDRLGVRSARIAAGGTTEDVALLVADQAGASLVVTVGTHATLDEFLDRQRDGHASTFLTRLRVGPRLVEARTVPALYSGRVRVWHLLLLVLVGIAALLVALATTPVGEQWLSEAGDALASLLSRAQGDGG